MYTSYSSPKSSKLILKKTMKRLEKHEHWSDVRWYLETLLLYFRYDDDIVVMFLKYSFLLEIHTKAGDVG